MSTINDEEWEKLKQSFQNSAYNSFLSGGPSILNNSTAGDEPSVLENMNSANGISDDDEEKVENLDESLQAVEQQKKLYSDKMYEEVKKLLDSQEINTDVVTLKEDKDYNYIMMTLSGTLLFDSGEVELREEAKPVLSKLGDILMMFAGYQIEIVGHTDNVPVTKGTLLYRDNNELSTDRALSTFYYLVNKKGLDPATMKYSGRGEYDPIADNKTEAGRKLNRRVEIKIYNEISRY